MKGAQTMSTNKHGANTKSDKRGRHGRRASASATAGKRGTQPERLARLYAVLSATNETVLRATSPEALYQGVTDAAVRGGKFVAASILVPDGDTGWLKRAGIAGSLKEVLPVVRISVKEEAPEGR